MRPLTCFVSVALFATPGVFRLSAHDTFDTTPDIVAAVVSDPASIARPVAPSNVAMLATPAGVTDGGVTVSFTVSTTTLPSAMSPDVVVITSVFVPAVQLDVAATDEGVLNEMLGVLLFMLQPTFGSTTSMRPP